MMMPDREKVIKGLECIAHQLQNGICGWCAYFKPFTDDPDCGWCDTVAIANDALALLRKQEPRVMAVREVERIGADNYGSFKYDGPTVMWLEEFGKQFPLHVVILKWDEDDWQGEPNSIVNVYYFGTDQYDQFSLTDYNKTWRCWTDKPTETQRMGAAWDGD